MEEKKEWEVIQQCHRNTIARVRHLGCLNEIQRAVP